MILRFNPPVIAHRGANDEAPENTIPAFEKAHQQGMQWLECDVMLTKDNKLVIFHDDTLDRTTNGKGNLKDQTYDYLRTLDAGNWGQWQGGPFKGTRIPNVEELMEFLSKSRMCANIELKLPKDASKESEKALAQCLAKEISKYKLESTIFFSSFSVGALQTFKQYLPNCALGLLLDKWIDGWENDYKNLGCQILNINHTLIDANSIKKIHEITDNVGCYTVNDPKRAAMLFDWGVKAVFSDCPKKIWDCTKKPEQANHSIRHKIGGC